MEEPRRPFLDSPVADQYVETTIETTGVGFTLAEGETVAANTKIFDFALLVPRKEISVSVVANEPTTGTVVSTVTS